MVARLRAVLAPPELRHEHQRIAEQWMALAVAYEEAKRVSGFLEWRVQRLRD